jgi:hypothetical protein
MDVLSAGSADFSFRAGDAQAANMLKLIKMNTNNFGRILKGLAIIWIVLQAVGIRGLLIFAEYSAVHSLETYSKVLIGSF